MVLESPELEDDADDAEAALAALTKTGGVSTGDLVHIELSGAPPAAGGIITRRFQAPVPDGTDVALAYYDAEHDAWTAVPTMLAEDRLSLTAAVAHFSIWTDIANAVTYGLGWALDTRVSAPSCEGGPPAWARDHTYLNDVNAPLRWCAGRDPNDPNVLVVKVAVNRGYGVSLTPKATPKWIWDSLFQGGTDDVLVGIYAGALLLPQSFGKGALLIPGGTEAHLGFTEEDVRRTGGSPLITVDPSPEYMVAGLTYTAITKAYGDGDGPAAAAVALLGIAQCGSTFMQPVRDKRFDQAAKAALDCLTDHSDDVARDLAGILAVQYPTQSTASLGKLAGQVGGKLWQVWAAGLVFGVGTWFADRALSSSAWNFHVYLPAQRPTEVRSNDLLRAPVPALCGHPAGRLVNGSLPGLGPTDGYVTISNDGTDEFGPAIPPVFADLTGDGTQDAAAVVYCSAGGVSWPDTVVLYAPGPRLLGAADFYTVHVAEHASVASMAAENGDVRVTWSTYEGCCLDMREWTARLHWDGSAFAIQDARQTG